MDNLYIICLEGDINKVLDAIKEGSNNWNDGLCGACEGGHINIVNLMIEKGANDWDYGLCGACEGGNINIINLMIEKGANDWDFGLMGACNGRDINVVNLMIEKGATNVNYYYEYPKDHNNIIQLLELGTPINKLLTIKCIKILVDNLKNFKETTYNELYQYMPKELANLVSNYCLL